MYKNALILLFTSLNSTLYSQNVMHKNIKIKREYNIIHYLGEPTEIKTEEAQKPPKDTIAVIEKKIENPYKRYLSSIPSILPLQNLNKQYFISSFYQKRMHPIEKQYKMHNGVDLSAPKGTPVYATADGIVLKLFYNNSAIGYAIKIKHSYNYSSLYGHLISQPYFKEADTIKRGQIIGYVGNTGLSTAPHLHYCVYYKQKPINPIRYIRLINE